MNKKFIDVSLVSLSALLISGTLLITAPKTFAAYGTSPSAPTCNDAAPGKASFSFVRKSGTSQMEIGWNAVSTATSWTVAYGTQSGKYTYGIANFGDKNSRSVNINLLPKGTYYIVVKANNGCMPGPFSDERKIDISSNGSITGTIVTRQVTPAKEITPAKVAPITSEPTVVVNNNAQTPQGIAPTPTPKPVEEHLNFFQRLWRFLFGG